VVGGNLLRLVLEYGTTGNNGSLRSQGIERSGVNLTQSYGYDGMERVTSFNEGGEWQSYGMDRYGNRWVSGSSMALHFATARNQGQ
jgi:hypothetical protein